MPKGNPVVAKSNCSGCETVVEIAISEGGTSCAYYYCPNCKHHERWGKAKTKEIFAEHFNKNKSTKEVTNEKKNSNDSEAKPEIKSSDNGGATTSDKRTEGTGEPKGGSTAPELRKPDTDRSKFWSTVNL